MAGLTWYQAKARANMAFHRERAGYFARKAEWAFSVREYALGVWYMRTAGAHYREAQESYDRTQPR